MNLVQCTKNNHAYDSETSTLCPQCGSPSADAVIASPIAAFGNTTFGFAENEVEFSRIGINQATSEWLSRKFRFVMPIAQGGMGRIVLVQELLSGRYVALKIMVEIGPDPMPITHQFIREAVITARLQHPNIVPVYDLGFLSENKLYYTMRYIDGRLFSDLLENTAFPLNEKLRILRSTAHAVNYAHSQGLWHRDLKPDNILVGPLGDTYVIDWGLVSIQPGKTYRLNLPKILVESQSIEVPDQLLERTSRAVTSKVPPTKKPAKNLVLGTPAYMAPDLIENPWENGGISADVWSIGIMLYETLTGRHPFQDKLSATPFELMYAIVHTEIPPILDSNPRASKHIAELCDRMLVKDPRKRLPSLDLFIKEIANYLGNLGMPQTLITVEHSSAITSIKNAAGRYLEESSLEKENKRLVEKNKILADLLALGPLDFGKKRSLYGRLAAL